MKKTARLGVVAAAVFAASVTGVSGAAAAPAGASGKAPVANPAQSCTAVQTTLAQLGVADESFSFSSCVRGVARQVPLLPAGDPYAQCATYEEEGIETPGGVLEFSYPFTFYAEGGPFPQLRANNREQCARALWTYHTIAGYFPEN